MSAIEGQPPVVGFDIDGRRKDVRTMIEEAPALGVEAPLVERVLDSYDAASKAGWGSRDASTLSAWRILRAKPQRT